MDAKLIDHVEERLGDVAAQAAAFSVAVGLRCPEGCGRCCLFPDVEASELEMMPLARELVRRGEAEALLERLAGAQASTRCVLYLSDPTDAARGRCAEYAWRPTICRVFAFAAVRGKRGRLELAACSVHRALDPERVIAAQAAIDGGTPVPVVGDVSLEIALLHPQGARRLPINEALHRAIERAALQESLTGRAPELGSVPNARDVGVSGASEAQAPL